jgi:hypothetical protein
MNETESSSSSWRIALLLAAGVVAVLIIALLMAQMDAVQRRSMLPPKNLPVVDADATVTQGDLPKVYLPAELGTTPILTLTPSSDPTATLEQPLTTFESAAKPICGFASTDWVPYTIQAGDSLAQLAKRFGISQNKIFVANCLTEEEFTLGQQILLPRTVASHSQHAQCEEIPTTKTP